MGVGWALGVLLAGSEAHNGVYLFGGPGGVESVTKLDLGSRALAEVIDVQGVFQK